MPMTSESATNRPTRVLMITATVDHGTRSITNAYQRAIQPFRTVQIPSSLAALGFRGLLALRREMVDAGRDADVVLCLHHGGVIATSLLMPKRRGIRHHAVLDWSRAFPSLRKDTYIRVYNPIFHHLLGRFDSVWSPARKFCEFYAKVHQVEIGETLYPLPYPDQLGETPPDRATPRALFIGADYLRKAGDVILNHWNTSDGPAVPLTFVCPNPPEVAVENVSFLKHIQAGTPEHLAILRDHDVFVFPSRREAFGYAALEALNFGQVVVTTRQAGIAPMVADAGGLVGDSPEEVVALALALARNPEEVRQRRERIRRFMATYPARLEQCLDQLRRRSAKA